MRPPSRCVQMVVRSAISASRKCTTLPTCREQFLNTRNLALEDLAREAMYPCKYRSYGCTEIFHHDTIGGLQAKCRYIPQVCPVAKLTIGNCSLTGSCNDIKGHLEENHPEECCEYVEGDFKFLYKLTSYTKCFCFIFAYNEIFFPLFQEKETYFMLFF